MTARPSGVVLKYVRPPVAMWKAPHCSATRPSCTSSARQSTSRAASAPYSLGPVGDAGEVGLVVLAEVGGVGVGDGALLPHPGDGGRGVEAAGEGDADPLADGKGGEDGAHGRPTVASRPGPARCRSRPAGSAPRRLAARALPTPGPHPLRRVRHAEGRLQRQLPRLHRRRHRHLDARARSGEFETTGFDFMVKKITIEWQSAARFGELLELDVEVRRWGTSSFDVGVVGRSESARCSRPRSST